MKIYTRKGDDGTTGLWYGGRRSKADVRIEAYGAVDEAGSALGLARSLCGPDESGQEIARRRPAPAERALRRRRRAGDRARGRRAPRGRRQPRSRAEMIGWMEEAIDRYMERVELPPKFVIPGGTQLSAQLDLARAILRRAERRVAALGEAGEQRAGPADRLRQPRRRPRLGDGPLHRRARARALRGSGLKRPDVVATRRAGFEHELEVGGHTITVDEPPDQGRQRCRPGADQAARRLARRLHRDHDRDVRGPQGLGRSTGSPSASRARAR